MLHFGGRFRDRLVSPIEWRRQMIAADFFRIRFPCRVSSYLVYRVRRYDNKDVENGIKGNSHTPSFLGISWKRIPSHEGLVE